MLHPFLVAGGGRDMIAPAVNHLSRVSGSSGEDIPFIAKGVQLSGTQHL